MSKREADAELVARAKSGDEAAFSEIYEQNYNAIYKYVYFRVTDVAIAEDITSDTFVRLVRKIDTFTPKRPILAWLYTIAGNLVKDHYRRSSRASFTELDERLSSGKNDPLLATHTELNADYLKQALSKLTEEQRMVIILKFVEARSNADVGRVLGKSEGAIKSLQHRALDSLRKILIQDGLDDLY